VGNKFFRTIRLGISSLLLHKLRSALAILGIFIGVTAVIWLVALGEGISYQAQQQIKELGATNIIVRSVKPPQDASNSDNSFFMAYGLLRDDFDRIMANIPSIKQAVPMREISREARYLDRATEIHLVGCTSAYKELNHLKMALKHGQEQGRFLKGRDRKDNVVVLANSTAEALFPYEDPLGRAVLIGDDFYVVIGVTADRTPSAAIGGSLEARDYNQDAYIPLSTLKERIGDMVLTSRSGSREGEIVQLSQITLTVDNVDLVDPTADIVHDLLKKFHKRIDYAVVVPKELLRQAAMMRAMFNVLLVLIAGISLLVGGIGIMNIMLATVTERTREIGIRRALGATRRDIIEQFLSETVVLSGVGGLFGVLCGYLCSPIVNGLRWSTENFLPDLWIMLPSNIQKLEPLIANWSVAVAFFISVGVGVGFGIYPARQAAFMDPIEALRHE